MSSSVGTTRTVLELDLVSYSDIARVLEENLDVHAVKAFQDQIQSFVDEGLRLLGLRREDVVFGTAGDNALLFFDDAATAHRFAEAVQRASADHNSRKGVESAKRWFRIGAATGVVLVLESDRRIVGTTVSRAVRLEAAARRGQLVVDTQTFDALPEELKTLYSPEEVVRGKREEQYTARRCTFIEGVVDPDAPPGGGGMPPPVHSQDGMKALAQDLEIVAIHSTKDWELDLTLRNTGDEPAVIHRITITVLEDHDECLPMIQPSAQYDVPIGDVSEGQSRSIEVSHYVDPHGVDRFKIALHTTRCLVLRITLHYNRVKSVDARVGVMVQLEPEELAAREDVSDFITWNDLIATCGTPVCARCLSRKELLQALQDRRIFMFGPPWVVTEQVQLGDLNEERLRVRGGLAPPRSLAVFPRPLPQDIRIQRRNFRVSPLSDIADCDTPAKRQELCANDRLLEAATTGNLSELKAALAEGADMNVCRQGRPGYRSWWGTVRRENALALAALNGHLDVVYFLLDQRASLANPCGSYAWFCAAYHGRTEIAKMLEEAGVLLELTHGQRQRLRQRSTSDPERSEQPKPPGVERSGTESG